MLYIFSYMYYIAILNRKYSYRQEIEIIVGHILRARSARRDFLKRFRLQNYFVFMSTLDYKIFVLRPHLVQVYTILLFFFTHD